MLVLTHLFGIYTIYITHISVLEIKKINNFVNNYKEKNCKYKYNYTFHFRGNKKQSCLLFYYICKLMQQRDITSM